MGNGAGGVTATEAAIPAGALPVQIEFIIAPNGDLSLTVLDEEIVEVLQTINPEFRIPVTEAADDHR